MTQRTKTASIFLASALTAFPLSARGQVPAKTDWKAPSRAKRKRNPFKADPATILAGKNIFLRNCMVCHGSTGKGDGPASAALRPKPKDLTDPAVSSQSDGELFWKIRTGKAPMPTFRSTLGEKDIWRVVVFLKSLGKKNDSPKPAMESLPPRKAVETILRRYLSLLRDLRAERWGASARRTAKNLSRLAGSLRITGSKAKKANDFWRSAKSRIQHGASILASGNDGFLEGFQEITNTVDSLITYFGVREKEPLSLFVCRMSGSKGGNLWIQTGTKPRNPFPWGIKMPDCGERVKTYPTATDSGAKHSSK